MDGRWYEFPVDSFLESSRIKASDETSDPAPAACISAQAK